MDKRRLSTLASTRLVNPWVRWLLERGAPLPGYRLLETTGRRSGFARRVPVGGRQEGDTIWITAEHGERAAYVRNIRANPRVRVGRGRRWRSGTATVVPEADWRQHQRGAAARLNLALVRAAGSDLTTVRVDLDPE